MSDDFVQSVGGLRVPARPTGARALRAAGRALPVARQTVTPALMAACKTAVYSPTESVMVHWYDIKYQRLPGDQDDHYNKMKILYIMLNAMLQHSKVEHLPMTTGYIM